MSHIIVDTETTSLDKPFCYDIGYLIKDGPKFCVKRHFIIEQVWHNLPLFESAYYKDKRPLYIQLMRQHKAIMDKWGYVMRQISRDIRDYNVTAAYAYNSDFDDRVIAFNCDWFKCNNPFEALPIYDIWGYASQFITNTAEYKKFCDDNQFYTDSGNYKGNAETVYKYITGDTEFVEAHMGLYDSEIESEILEYCLTTATPETSYPVIKILERETETPYQIKVNGVLIHQGEYTKQYTRNKTWFFNEKVATAD